MHGLKIDDGLEPQDVSKEVVGQVSRENKLMSKSGKTKVIIGSWVGVA